MKKIYFIGILILIILFATTTSIYAGNTILTFEGEDNVEVGSEGSVIVKLESDELIGGIKGKIETSSNLTIKKVQAIDDEDADFQWALRYYKETENFNAYKEDGTKNCQFMKIYYTASDVEGRGSITIKEIEVSEIKENNDNTDDERFILNSVSLENITKEINIVKTHESDDPGADNPGKDDPGTDNPGTDNPGTDNPGTDNPGTDNPGKDNQDTNNPKKDNQEIDNSKNIIPNETKVDSKKTTANNSITSTKTSLPKAGFHNIIIPIIIILISIGAVLMYKKYKKYSNLK